MKQIIIASQADTPTAQVADACKQLRELPADELVNTKVIVPDSCLWGTDPHCQMARIAYSKLVELARTGNHFVTFVTSCPQLFQDWFGPARVATPDG